MSINALPQELLAQIFVIGTGDEINEEEGAWEDANDDEDEERDDDIDRSSHSSDSDPGIPLPSIHDIDMEAIGDANIIQIQHYSLEDAIKAKRKQESKGSKDTAESVEERNNLWKPSTEFPVLVSHVCQHWRRVALDTPSLWSTIDFSEGPPYEKSQTWVERSKGAELYINIEHTEDDKVDIDMGDPPERLLEDLERMLNIVSPHASRWATFSLSVSHTEHMDMALSEHFYKCGETTRLISLKLYDNSDDAATYDPSKFRHLGPIFGGHAPLLTVVTFWGVHIDWSTCDFLSGLDFLELAYHEEEGRPSWEDFARMLTSSPGLRTLTLASSGPRPEEDDQLWPPENEILTLPSLEVLSLAYFPPEYAHAMLQRIDLPLLHDLELDIDEGDPHTLVDRLIAPKRNLLENLYGLKISAMDLRTDDIRRMYSHLNNCLTLHLNFSFLDVAWLTLIHEPDPSAPPEAVPLPLLKVLVGTGVEHLIPDLRKLVTARKTMERPLHKLLLAKQDDIEPDDIDWFRKEVEEVELFDNSDDDPATDDDEELEEDEGAIILEMDDIWEGEPMDDVD